MVSARILQRFVKGEQGISFVEGLVVFPLVLLTFSAFIEFGYAVFQWNQTVKAAQLGARLAAVSDPIASDMGPLTADYPTAQGGVILDTAVSVACIGSGPTGCIVDGLDRLIARMSGGFNEKITRNNVDVTYHRSGLGYVGRPGGPVVTITVEIHDVTFDLPIMGALFGLDDFIIPPSLVTITSEDLSTNKI